VGLSRDFLGTFDEGALEKEAERREDHMVEGGLVEPVRDDLFPASVPPTAFRHHDTRGEGVATVVAVGPTAAY
jgi:hypothetical protein